MTKNNNLYKLVNDAWYVQLSGMSDWQKVDAGATLDLLKSTYSGGGAVGNSSSGGKIGKAEGEQLDKKFKILAYKIKTYIETDSNFSTYSGVNDNEAGAWNNVVSKHFNRILKPELDEILKYLNTFSDDATGTKKDYMKNAAKFTKMLDTKNTKNPLRVFFVDGQGRFPFQFEINLYSGVKKYTIDTNM